MGQREKHLASDSNWHESLTPEERLQRWPSSASFGLALSGKASRAVAAADRAVAIAEAAREMVIHQATYALVDEGGSVREIADHLKLSKSRVGRILKRLSLRDSTGNVAFLAPRGAESETLRSVLDAWGFADLSQATADHPRGTHEPQPASLSPRQKRRAAHLTDIVSRLREAQIPAPDGWLAFVDEGSVRVFREADQAMSLPEPGFPDGYGLDYAKGRAFRGLLEPSPNGIVASFYRNLDEDIIEIGVAKTRERAIKMVVDEYNRQAEQKKATRHYQAELSKE